MSDLPCKNPNCASHGKPHPNCKCYGGMAKGGEVHFCLANEPHKSDCKYYAEGGSVHPLPTVVDNPGDTMGHAASHHGLLGLLKDVGRTKLSDPDKHSKVLEHAKDQHMQRSIAGDSQFEEPKKTLGYKLGNHIADGKHEDAAELLHGHPLVGSTGKTHLKPVLERMSHPMMIQEPHADGFRNSVDYLSSSLRGRDKLDTHLSGIFGLKKHDEIDLDKDSREELKKHLEQIKLNPESLLETGGSVGHYLPGHAAQLGNLAVVASDYLEKFKPQQSQNRPLDEISKPDRGQEALYNRQLDIAQNPNLILQHVKDGTLQPTDLMTLAVLYPGLHKSMIEKAGEKLIEAKAKGLDIPYRQKQSLSMLLGQPLDSTMVPMNMQAIMTAQGPQQIQQQSKKSPKKASGVELKQINKTDSLYETPIEARQVEKRK